MVEVRKTVRGITVRVVNGLHPWDVEERFFEDLLGGGDVTFKGVTCSDKDGGVLLDPCDHLLVVRASRSKRMIFGGHILLRKDEVTGRQHIDLLGDNASRVNVA